MINSDVEICNLALSRLGNVGSVENINTPIKTNEIACALWYNVSRQKTLKLLMPNFALCRDILAISTTVPSFGYSSAYPYPQNCLKLLGIGEIQEKQNNYSIESGMILTSETYTNGMPIRYIKDVTDVNKFTPEFITLLSWFLAYNICIPITQNIEKQAYMEQILPRKISEAAAVNAQENRPIRISRSLFKAARTVDNPRFYNKQ